MGLFSPDKKPNEIKIKWLNSIKSGIAQIYSSGLEYALCNKNNEQCHDFVFCKDFVQDAIHAHLHGGVASIYGFTYTPKKNPDLDLDRLRLLVVNSNDAKLGSKIPNVLNFLNQFCKKLKLKPTYAYRVSNPPSKYKSGCWLIDASGMWNNAPVLVSMFTLLLRVGFVHPIDNPCMDTIKQLIDGKIKPYQNNDKNYVQQGLKGIEDIIKLGYRKFFYIDIEKNYPKGTNIGTMHNSTGIVAFSQGQSKSVVPYWHRKSIHQPNDKKDD